MTNTKSRFSSVLDVLSFNAARFLVTLEEYLPPHLKPRRTASYLHERNEFARAMIEVELKEVYSFEQILHCRNIINANDQSRSEMGRTIDLDGAFTRFKLTGPPDMFVNDFNTRSLLPHRSSCNYLRDGIACNSQLRLDFHMTAYVIYPTSIQPCTLYKADCKGCRRSYRVSSIYCSSEREFVMTPECLKDNEYFHLSCGKFVYSRELLVSFSSDLVNGHISFNGAGNALLSKIARLRPDVVKKVDAVQLSRSLEAHWTYYELFNFLFMTSAEKEIAVPRALFSGTIYGDSECHNEHLLLILSFRANNCQQHRNGKCAGDIHRTTLRLDQQLVHRFLVASRSDTYVPL